MKYAVLIDAGFLKRKLGSQAQPLGLQGVCAFLARLRAHNFVPAMKFARREGVQLYLVTPGHAVRAAMLEHSDLVLDLPVELAAMAPQVSAA